MPTDETWQYAVGALAALGIGVAAYTALNASARRTAFKNALRVSLDQYEIELVGANLARSNGVPKWMVTINDPTIGVVTYRVSIHHDTDPYSQHVLDETIQRVIRAVENAVKVGGEPK